MFLTVLGKYGLYPKMGGRTSGYVISSESANIAFEMGAGVFSHLQRFVLPEALDAVIISHLHYDHMSDLGVFNYYLESLNRSGKLKNKIKLVLPACDAESAEFAKGFAYFEPIFVKAEDKIEIGGIAFKFFMSKHPKPCLGFKAVCREENFLYSGDSDVCSEIEENLKDVDLALLDGAFLPEGYREGGPHMSIDKCVELSSKFGVRTIVSHLLPNMDEGEYLRHIPKNAMVKIAEEGKTYSIKTK